MSDDVDDERQLRIELMRTQIDLYRSQHRWEVWKALAAMIAASAVFAGSVIGLSNWLRPSQPPPPQQIIINVPANPQSGPVKP